MSLSFPYIANDTVWRECSDLQNQVHAREETINPCRCESFITDMKLELLIGEMKSKTIWFPRRAARIAY